jgi:group I intron endonuclease
MGWIYLIKNKLNGKCYVGQTIKKKAILRWHEHRRQPQGCLKYAFEKHGFENFEFSTICEIPESDGWREALDAREIFEIKERNTLVPNGYNIEDGGNKKKTIKQETKQKLSQVLKGRKRSAEIRKMVGDAHFKKVEQWSKDGLTLIEVHTSLKGAGEKLNISPPSISMCSRGKRVTAGGFRWKLHREQTSV